MKNSIPAKLVILTVCLYASSWGGTLYPRILQRLSGVDDDTLLSAPSRLAQSNLALMLIIQLIAAVSEVAVARRSRARASYFGIIQASLLLLYFGLLTFDMFLGPVSLHHGPDFSLSEFIRFGFGAYPVALILIGASTFLVWRENQDQKNEK